jgi:hypothetical protein
LRLGEHLVLEDLGLHALLPMGMPKSPGLSNARSSVFDGINATRSDDVVVESVVVRTSETNIGCRVGIIVGAYVWRGGMFGVEIWFANFWRCLGTRVERSRTPE